MEVIFSAALAGGFAFVAAEVAFSIVVRSMALRDGGMELTDLL